MRFERQKDGIDVPCQQAVGREQKNVSHAVSPAITPIMSDLTIAMRQ